MELSHISDVIKKADKRMFFLILLNGRAKVPARDIIGFYNTCNGRCYSRAHHYTTMNCPRI